MFCVRFRRRDKDRTPQEDLVESVEFEAQARRVRDGDEERLEKEKR